MFFLRPKLLTDKHAHTHTHTTRYHNIYYVSHSPRKDDEDIFITFTAIIILDSCYPHRCTTTTRRVIYKTGKYDYQTVREINNMLIVEQKSMSYEGLIKIEYIKSRPPFLH